MYQTYYKLIYLYHKTKHNDIKKTGIAIRNDTDTIPDFHILNLSKRRRFKIKPLYPALFSQNQLPIDSEIAFILASAAAFAAS